MYHFDFDLNHTHQLWKLMRAKLKNFQKLLAFMLHLKKTWNLKII